jgi:hypothetical protein
MARIVERKNWKSNRKDDLEGCEIKREEFGTILKKRKDGNASVEYNMLSEMYKYL